MGKWKKCRRYLDGELGRESTHRRCWNSYKIRWQWSLGAWSGSQIMNMTWCLKIGRYIRKWAQLDCCSFNFLFQFQINMKTSYLHLFWQWLDKHNIDIIGPGGPDTLLQGLILVHLSGVWLGEANEFKFLSVFISHVQPTPWVQHKPINSLSYSMLGEGYEIRDVE